MRLKQHQNALERTEAGCCQCRFDFGRMMTVIIHDRDVVYHTPQRKTTVDAAKGLQAFADLGSIHFHFQSDADRRRRVQNVM